MHKAFPLSVKSSHCQKKFSLLLRKVPPPEDKRCHCQEDRTAIKGREFGDSYEAPDDVVATGSATEGTGKKKGRTVALTTEDMQKRKNDAAILKTFGGNKATKKTKKNLLKQQYGNFKAEGSETLEQTFIRLQAIVSHLEFMDIEIKQDDLNQKFLTSVRSEVQKKSESNSQNMAFISSAKNNSEKEDVNTASILTTSTNVSPASVNIGAVSISQDTACAYIASHSSGSQIKFEDITQIDKDDMEEIFMANKEDDHALVADEENPTEFALMAKTSADSEVESRLVEFKNQEVKYCEKIKGLEFKVEARANRIECLTNELELLKKEKEGLESKLTCFQSASKDLDSLLESQRSDKNKEGLGYNDTVTDYSRPLPAIESTLDDLQNRNPSVTETGASPSNIVSKPFIKFVKATDSPTENKADKVETVRKTTVKYAELYRKTLKKSNVRGVSLKKSNKNVNGLRKLTSYQSMSVLYL
nr:hypothetical protein [Tanacetum cinerariifolium]